MLDAEVDMGKTLSDKCSNFLTFSGYPDVSTMQQTPDEDAVGITASFASLWPFRRRFSMCLWTHEKTFFS
jgi:hypothetical protein